jgi:hypothetical protein
VPSPSTAPIIPLLLPEPIPLHLFLSRIFLLDITYRRHKQSHQHHRCHQYDKTALVVGLKVELIIHLDCYALRKRVLDLVCADYFGLRLTQVVALVDVEVELVVVGYHCPHAYDHSPETIILPPLDADIVRAEIGASVIRHH